jgi:hypothetical protein
MTAPNDSNEFMASLPRAVRAALEAQDVQALDLALRALPRDEAEALGRWLVVAGVLVERTEAEVDLEQRFAYYLPPWPRPLPAAIPARSRPPWASCPLSRPIGSIRNCSDKA